MCRNFHYFGNTLLLSLFGFRLAPVFCRIGFRWLFVFALVPGILIGALFFFAIYQNEKEHLQEGALQTARALAQVADRDLVGATSKLEVLATAPSLQAGDWISFHAQARAILAREALGRSIVMIDEVGQQIINTRFSSGSRLPKVVLSEHQLQVFAGGAEATSISDLYYSEDQRVPSVFLSIPVLQQGKHRYVLGMEIPAESLGKILVQQNLPAHWLAALLDSKGVVLARNLNSAQFVGKPVMPDLLAAIEVEKEGIKESHTLEGIPSFLAFSRGEKGYVVVVGLTRQVLYENISGPLALAGLLIGAFLLAGIVFSWLFSKSIRGSLQTLMAAAESATKGNLAALVQPSGPRELVRLAEQFNAMQMARKTAEDKLHIAAAAFESQEAMLITDANNVILRVNRAFMEITGYSSEELVGQTPSLLKSGRHDAEFYRAMWASLLNTGAWQGEVWDRRKNGEVYPKWLTISAVKNAEGALTHYIATHSDITERKKAEQRIEELAFFDQLTGLPNRMLLQDRLKQALASSLRTGEYGALLFIDLDNFKILNDTMGHDKGDLLVQKVARRLKGCLRECDTPARVGGDEFVLILTGLEKRENEAASGVETVVEKVLTVLRADYQLEDTPYQCSASIGVTLFRGDQAAGMDDIFKQAELAMYKAKATGRNSARFFDPTLESSLKERMSLERDLRVAVDTQQFLLHYQPQVSGNLSLTGVEALVRWQHPVRGMVSPADFIPLAEETGMILPLGHWVLETACQQLALWKNRPEMAHLTIAVNVSASQLHQDGFVEEVLAVVESTGANPQRLKLELTESQLVKNVQEIIEKMVSLKAEGIGFSLDDFGTGYSSLSYLKRLPLDQLKIDQSFVRDVLTDPNDAAIAKTIVALGKSLGLNVIAEGVETSEQRDFLADSGCFAYQGYYFSRPVPIEAFETYAQGFSEP